MNDSLRNWIPTRERYLLVHELNDELLVYDKKQNKAHCLNSTIWSVWKLCNGENTVGNIIDTLCGQAPKSYTVESIGFALKQLRKKGLLSADIPADVEIRHFSRREMIRRAGSGALIALPFIASIVVPTAAEAASCFSLGHPCSTNGQCCSGHCGILGLSLVCL